MNKTDDIKCLIGKRVTVGHSVKGSPVSIMNITGILCSDDDSETPYYVVVQSSYTRFNVDAIDFISVQNGVITLL